MKKSFRNSIKFKVIIATFSLVILTYCATVLISLIPEMKHERAQIRQTALLMVEKKTEELEHFFGNIETSIATINEYIENTIDENKILEDKAYEESYFTYLTHLLLNGTKHSKGVTSIYFHMEAEKYGGSRGVFLTGNSTSGYVTVKNTDIKIYSPTDTNHVGWYYLPIWKKAPVWTNPYENKNINTNVISYVTPLYKNGELLGVVGIDINLAVLRDIIDTMMIDDALCILVGEERNLIYKNNSIVQQKSVEDSADISAILTLFYNSDKYTLNTFSWNKEMYLGNAAKLGNGMTLITGLPTAPILANYARHLLAIFLLFIVVCIVTFLALCYENAKILKPIHIITKTTYKLSRGEINLEIPYKSNNEIGTLADNIRKMTSQMIEYIDFIREQTDKERKAKEAAITESKSKSEFLASMYISLHEIDLKNDTFEEVHSRGDIGLKARGAIGNANAILTQVMKQTTDESSWPALIPFIDLSTINDRMKNQITMTQEFLGAGGKWCRGRFIAMDRDAAGNLHHVLWSVEYIDDEKKEREQLQGERDRLKLEAEKNAASSQAKSAFLANMSHEIRTPINAVLGMDEMILREATDSEILGYATNIKTAGTNLLGIVNEILDFSKIEAGKMALLQEQYDFSSLVIDLVNMISERAKKKNLKLNLDINPNIPKSLYGDSIRLRQCIINLLTNAVKYTKEGSVTLSMDYKKIASKKIILMVSVKDTGTGIKPENMEKLFSPFERIEEGKNKTIEGTGLGISIVTRILTMMDSKLNVESEYGKGSNFHFDIEQVVLDWEKIGDINEIYENNASEISGYKEKLYAPKAKLLFVDDTEMNLEVIKGLLKKTGMQIDTVLSGAETLEKVKETAYDIIFIDHRMPEMDGIETLHAMKKMKKNLSKKKPCIALTANAISGVKQMYLDAGFTDYLSKPVSPEKLEEVIRHYLPEEYIEKLPEDENIEDSNSELSEEEKAEQKELSELEAKLAEIKGIDLKDALTNCGNKEILITTLRNYYSSIEDRANELQKYFDEGDWENYGIKVHSLKSTSRLIGAMELSKLAEDLEKYADEKKIEKIQKKHKSLMNLFLSYKEKLGTLITEDDVEKVEILESDFEEYLQIIAKYANDFNLNALDSVIEELADVSIPEKYDELFKKIKTSVQNVDFKTLKELTWDLLPI